MRLPIVILALVSLSACAERSACPGGATTMSRTELLFGRDRAAGPPISDAEWTDFVAAEVTPRFPNGISVIDAAGQWRGNDGAIVREASKIVVVLAPTGADTRARLSAIADAYKVRFHQESVGIVSEPACVSF